MARVGGTVGAGGRGDIVVIAANGDGDVLQAGDAAVRRVIRMGDESARLRRIRLQEIDPGVRAALAEQVAGDVPCGQAAEASVSAEAAAGRPAERPAERAAERAAEPAAGPSTPGRASAELT